MKRITHNAQRLAAALWAAFAAMWMPGLFDGRGAEKV